MGGPVFLRPLPTTWGQAKSGHGEFHPQCSVPTVSGKTQQLRILPPEPGVLVTNFASPSIAVCAWASNLPALCVSCSPLCNGQKKRTCLHPVHPCPPCGMNSATKTSCSTLLLLLRDSAATPTSTAQTSGCSAYKQNLGP